MSTIRKIIDYIKEDYRQSMKCPEVVEKVRGVIAGFCIGLGVLTVLLLSGCTKTIPVINNQQRTQLEIPVQKPLVLTDMTVKVIELDGELWVAMTMDNYAILSRNTEDMQARLNEYSRIIQEQSNYYKN